MELPKTVMAISQKRNGGSSFFCLCFVGQDGDKFLLFLLPILLFLLLLPQGYSESGDSSDL